MSSVSCFFLAVLSVKSQQGPPIPLNPWPNQFSMLEDQYNYVGELWATQNDLGDDFDGYEWRQNYYWYYDYTNLQLRTNGEYISGTLAPDAPKNVSSWWIQNRLTIVDWSDAQENVGNCTSTEFPFGMPRPDWFVDNSTYIQDIWLTHYKWNNITKTWQLMKESPDGPFYYFAMHNTFQQPMRIEAPSGGFGEGVHVVNDIYEYVVGEPNPNLFKIPNYLDCGDTLDYYEHYEKIQQILKSHYSTIGMWVQIAQLKY